MESLRLTLPTGLPETIRNLGLPGMAFAVIAGCFAAVLVVASPMIGMGAVAGLIVYGIVTKRAEIPFTLLCLSFAIPYQKAVGGIPLNMSDGVIVLWGLAWPFLMMRKADTPFKIPFVIWAALPLVICASLSLLVAVNPAGAFKQVLRLLEWFIILPILMTSLRVTENFWKWVSLLFLLIPSFFALDGIVEVLMNGKSITSMIGIPHPIPSKEHSAIRHTFDISGRAGSTFGGAQGLAMYLTMMMSIIMSFIYSPQNKLLRNLAIICLGVCMAGMVVAKSRGGFLGFGVSIMVITLISHPKFGFSMLVAGGLAAAAGLFYVLIFYTWDGTLVGLIPGRKEAVMDRLIIWDRSFSVFLQHPLLGVGFGGFHDEVYATGGIALTVPLGYESLHSHNTYLEVLSGTGILGFISYITFLVLCFRRLLNGWHNRIGKPSDCFILGALGAMGAYMMFCMVDMLFLQNMHFMLISIIMLGMLSIEEKQESPL